MSSTWENGEEDSRSSKETILEECFQQNSEAGDTN